MILLFMMLLSVPDPGGELTWLSFNEGMAKAGRENKIVLIDVYTEWCGYCKKMDAETYTDARIVGYLREKYVLIKLNPETDGTVRYNGQDYPADVFAQSMRVTGYPATAFFESDGKMITMVPGYLPADDFLPILEYMAEKQYYQVSYQEFLEQRK